MLSIVFSGVPRSSSFTIRGNDPSNFWFIYALFYCVFRNASFLRNPFLISVFYISSVVNLFSDSALKSSIASFVPLLLASIISCKYKVVAVIIKETTAAANKQQFSVTISFCNQKIWNTAPHETRWLLPGCFKFEFPLLHRKTIRKYLIYIYYVNKYLKYTLIQVMD